MDMHVGRIYRNFIPKSHELQFSTTMAVRECTKYTLLKLIFPILQIPIVESSPIMSILIITMTQCNEYYFTPKQVVHL